MWKRVVGVVLVMFAAIQSGRAHDYWLQPRQCFLAPGETTDVQLFVGDHFAEQAERPFQAKMTVKLQLVGQKQVQDLKATGKNGAKPACSITPQQVGNHLVVMERDWSHIEIEAAKFNKYLEHEGLTEILAKRREAGEGDTVGRERYRRYLKALVQVGDRHDQTFGQKIGHRLEILPLANPYAAEQRDRLGVSVLFDGKPLRGAQVTAYNRSGDDTTTQTARTDNQGQVHFTLDQSGPWLIRLVHMRRCQDVSKFDWESFWAAYSFQLK